MTCGSCVHADGYCYTSLPPRVKCTITGEFHYYGDECNCKDACEIKGEQLVAFYKALNNPILAYDPADTTVLNGMGENKVNVDLTSLIEVNEHDSYTTTTLGACNCLICGETIFINAGENSPKICDMCKKTVIYLREKFRDEIERIK
jgi:hypothetical protein